MSVVPAKTDGRNARTERTRSAVVEAMLSLIDGGDLRPTAKRVAERANISLRSVFQHFADLESLFAAVADAQQGRLAWLISQETGEGPGAERIHSFVKRRAKLLETITPMRRAALLQEAFSAELARRLRWAHDMARGEIERVFAPELAAVPASHGSDIVLALDVVTNWSAWDTSRRLNGLSIEGSKRVMEITITALLNENRFVRGTQV